MTLTILRGKAVVTTVTLTYDEAHWTPFEGEEKLAGLLRGTFQVRFGRVVKDGSLGPIYPLADQRQPDQMGGPLASISGDSPQLCKFHRTIRPYSCKRFRPTPILRNSITRRNASFTAPSSRKALRTSGSSRTRLVPA